MIMTQQDKDLLLRDLSARLPYGVKVKYAIPTLLVCVRNDRDGIKVITEGTYGEHVYNIEDFKPYLRPMSSMTEKERKELQEIAVALSYNKDDIMIGAQINSFRQLNGVLDLFNSHHLDWRGLIEKGLAIEALDGMYNLKD